MTIWLLASTAPADQAACRPFIPVARAAIAEALARQGVPLSVSWLAQEVVWAARLDESDPSRCAIGWGGNPPAGLPWRRSDRAGIRARARRRGRAAPAMSGRWR